MKKEILIGIIGVIALIIGSFVAWNSYNEKQNTVIINSTNNASVTNSIQDKLNNETATGATTLSTDVIAEHSTENDCWLLISDKVYDVSSYLISHPGGKNIVIPYCGKDATAAFANQGGQGTHSTFAQSQLGSFFVGDLNMPLTQIGNSNTVVITNTNSNTPTNTTTTPTVSVTLNTATIAQHNTTSNCWIIINSTVYAVSSYLSSHPGGSSIIAQYCGKDATAAFANQGGQGSHSSFANSELARFAIGTVGSTTTTQQIDTTQNNTNTSTPSGDEQEDEEEDEESEQEDD